MLTIQDIANMAGVSKATVSRVLNNNGYVKAETRQHIEDIIEANNYSPSATAINLSKRETTTIGVIVPEIDNTFFAEILQGITQICDENDLLIICCDTQNNMDKEEKALKMLEKQRVRGVIMTPAIEYKTKEEIDKIMSLLQKLKAPVVIVDREFENDKLDAVIYENFKAGYYATSELIKAGHKRIGIITGDLSLKIARERFDGYVKAMSDNNLEINQNDILEGNFMRDKAFSITTNMLESKNYPPAMVTSNNRTSLGFLKAVKHAGLEIGKDIAVIGIDHIRTLDIIDYDFSCVTRDVYEMGRMSMNLLLERLRDSNKPRQIHTMPCKLSIKGSEKICE